MAKEANRVGRKTFISVLRCVSAPLPWARLQSYIVVWAIEEGRKAARGVDKYLMYGESYLP
jgi:NADPH-dependent glutamate synthase beta subunit-like oxidoreductase